MPQNALSFDGVNDYVQTNITSLTGTKSRTIEAWIKTGTVTSQRVIVGMGTMPVGTRFTLNVLNSKLRIEIGGGGINSVKNVDDNQWHHVAVVYNAASANDFELYIDGVIDASGNISGTTVNTAAGAGVAIGRRNDAVNHFSGLIDDVRIWDVPRTAAQIAANMNNEICSATGLVAYYKLNEGNAGGNNAMATTASDASGNGNNGTLTGFALSGNSSNWLTGNNLSAGNNTTSSFAVSSCGTYTAPSGATYSSSQTITDIIPNSQGCDSVMTITLTVGANSSSSFSATGCGSYTAPSGAIYTSSQVITDVIANAGGCDSVMTITVAIFNVDTSVTQTFDTLTANTGGATFQWLNCDTGMPVVGATSATFVPTANGNYAVQITVNSCVDTSSCYSVMNVNTQKQSWASNLKYLPNPTQGNLFIDLGNSYSDVRISVLAMDGAVIYNNFHKETQQIEINLDAPAGMYFIQIQSQKEQATFKVVKF